jgi:hypothetical protein
MRRLLIWILPFVVLVLAVSALSVLGAALGDPAEHASLGALGSVQFVLNTNAAALTTAMAVLIALVLLTVQLAAQRYSFSVIDTFVQDRVNVVLVGLFITTIMFNLWLGLVLKENYIPGFATLGAMALTTLCFALLPPYIFYLFDAIRADRILDHVQDKFACAVEPTDDRARLERQRAMASLRMHQIGDIAQTAVSLGDTTVARHSVWVLYGATVRYLDRKRSLPVTWFAVDEHRYRGRHELIAREIESTGTWVEASILDELREVFTATLNKQHDVNATVAVVVRLLGQQAIQREDAGLIATIFKYFNTFLRAAINQGDVRAGYHVLHQYRLLADSAMERQPDLTVQIAQRIGFYGDAAAGGPLLWMAAAAAYDLRILAEQAEERGVSQGVIGAIVSNVVDSVRRAEARQSPALLQLYKTAIALGAFFLSRGKRDDAEHLSHLLAHVPRTTVERAVAELATVDDPVFWELTDRVVNFDYVQPEARARLADFVDLALAAPAVEAAAIRPGAVAPTSS